MSKKIKLSNETFLDTSSVIHDDTNLKTYLNNAKVLNEETSSNTNTYSCNYINSKVKIKRYQFSSGGSITLTPNKCYLIAVQVFTIINAGGVGTVLGGYSITWANKNNFECTNNENTYTFSSSYGSIYILVIEML
mgnify:CR=1 FL=1